MALRADRLIQQESESKGTEHITAWEWILLVTFLAIFIGTALREPTLLVRVLFP